jgi:hypothetical protein
MKHVVAILLSLLLPTAGLAAEPTADDATTAIATAPAPQPSPAARRLKFHRIAGYTSGGLTLAGGAVGMAQWGSLAAEGHAYREEQGIEEGELDDDCAAYIRDLWAEPKHAALRGIHGGLILAGEGLYVSNAVTGMRMRTQGFKPGKLHRIAMMTQGALLLAEVGLGVGTTVALSRGDHDAQLALGGAHAVLGLVIPIWQIGSGVAIDHATH